MQALAIYAGPAARRHLENYGLSPSDVRVIPAAAGGPKGLILLPLDRFLFGRWLSAASTRVDLVGASIGAWRLAAACFDNPAQALRDLERRYIQQRYEVPPGRKRPTPEHVSERFAEALALMFGPYLGKVVAHPRYRLHIVTTRGRGLLAREARLRTRLGYAAAALSNALSRHALDHWLERVVFSSEASALPFAADGFRTRRYPLTEVNLLSVLQASCAIPFVLTAVREIPGAKPGAYWDGGLTDYHLHLDYRSACAPRAEGERGGVVLYPHFQRAVVPGWLDKPWRWRHRATAFLDTTLLLAPRPEWVATLPHGKLPDRSDFLRYGQDTAARVAAWTHAVRAAEQLADEFAEWLERGTPLDQVATL
ncbi:MAG: patatin-like phospholipase family protein [Casimicrobiaceae bacterium]|nr:patatin-like phospholipase family protein [Casimicrobiaceae bacterium]MDW8311626.1 patatin-like phospholipase family protein [Burkholderiales bacterium]